ncbi:MAG: DEAD/DEAH box helicase family protein [Betaproteobacteria bacterium]|nr:DEAD/DEAH box helicase family protein [Betaproteobacteria bacterium]
MDSYTEADTCRKFVVPKLQDAGWDDDPCSIAEQRSITDGRIVPAGQGFIRKPPLRVDYLLRFRRDLPLAVVEAKAVYKSAADGLQQAKRYAEMLGLKFAYATNGRDIIEFDFFAGLETNRADFPTPTKLWARYRKGSGLGDDGAAERIVTPSNHEVGKGERYYQQIAIQRAVEAIVTGRRRLLITMATGTGKTAVAFQICWKLWNARWNRTGEHRRPKILYLADRNILVDQPKDGIFAAFGDARCKLGDDPLSLGREMYFAIYQALAEDERRIGLFKAFPPDFFDLVIVDECHRGSARYDSAWRIILEYFEPAVQLGMTATPLRDETRDTYLYFGNPIYTYSLRQGIEDGFLAPYRVHRVITEWDAAGWRPTKDEIDRYGRVIPDEEYQTKDFEHIVALRARTETMARHLTKFMKKHDRLAKTIVFCVDQEHASEMARALGNLNADLRTQYPDYVCRVTADEGDIGRGHLSRFQDVDTRAPVILTTSQLLTTGVDAPTCKNVVLARIVGSMTEFKQIIGRGTRVRDDYGKLWFNIVDYAGSATRQFADPDFDGEPAHITEEELLADGESRVILDEYSDETSPQLDSPAVQEPPPEERRKYYFDGGRVEIAAHLVYELDAEGRQLGVVRYTEYAADKIRTLCPTARDLHQRWADPEQRAEIIRLLAERGIAFDQLAEEAKQPEADPFDLLCHLAFNAPLRTRRERAQRLKSERKDFFQHYGPEARQILDELLEKYAAHGDAQFVLPDVLHVPPISAHGSPGEIIRLFGGAEQLRDAVARLQAELYAA